MIPEKNVIYLRDLRYERQSLCKKADVPQNSAPLVVKTYPAVTRYEAFGMLTGNCFVSLLRQQCALQHSYNLGTNKIKPAAKITLTAAICHLNALEHFCSVICHLYAYKLATSI